MMNGHTMFVREDELYKYCICKLRGPELKYIYHAAGTMATRRDHRLPHKILANLLRFIHVHTSFRALSSVEGCFTHFTFVLFEKGH